MAKGRGKKGKDKKLAEEKRIQLQKLWDFVQTQHEEYEAHLNSVCKNTCDKIKKMYDDKLKSLPENIRNMTLSEYMEMQQKSEEAPQSNVNGLRSEFVKSKILSEKKTHKKMKSERTRSISSSICSGGKGIPLNLLARSSRVLSESCLSTPRNNRSVVPSYVITPKFNPNVPLSKNCMRKPRAGEIVLSVSGSPIQNFADEPAVSLGGGNIIKLTDQENKIENDFMKKLDEETKSTLQNVKKILEKML